VIRGQLFVRDGHFILIIDEAEAGDLEVDPTNDMRVIKQEKLLELLVLHFVCTADHYVCKQILILIFPHIRAYLHILGPRVDDIIVHLACLTSFKATLLIFVDIKRIHLKEGWMAKLRSIFKTRLMLVDHEQQENDRIRVSIPSL